jgi:hypothetical protein
MQHIGVGSEKEDREKILQSLLALLRTKVNEDKSNKR